ncbi:site-specific DNA-methyltransferase (adenine-specific) [Algoriphagus alkaliphilus]|uniref:Methyltransferase n=1 Tax=Algoriphagus alkaliphilus TaxID=279824 RepID=A0A1G5WBG9_9BACT|nr:site-specific DNA-methyltransferase [Algoriphagus alkaliphilus]MBA4302509.1 site-specific DNA-methyltransferase [Cyclobacterium sp.]SDA55342.1 site-specific DNA-methyltransferase (adenine-specific) [Algoriphagus alkaliphilus]
MISAAYKSPTYEVPITITNGDVRDILSQIPSKSIQCTVTSPPYWGVRDYKVKGQIGAEPDINSYVQNLVEVFSEVRRVLKDDGTFWLNIGNTYTSGGRKWRQEDGKNKGRAMSYRPDTPEGLKKKDLIGVAWMVALACQLDGWYLRNDIIWNKPNCQPESVKDRLTVGHEYMFLMTKSEKYYFNQHSIMEDTKDGLAKKNRRSVWNINTEPYNGAHFATFPPTLVNPCILAGTKPGDIVFDPFLGSGTVCAEALRLGRLGTGIELNLNYAQLAERRILAAQPLLFYDVG